MSEKIKEYSEFWPYYLREHSNPNCRRLRYLGTTLALLTLLLAIIYQMPVILIAALIAGYGPVRAVHFFIEGNRPTTVTSGFCIIRNIRSLNFSGIEQRQLKAN